jgi:hypothetical protein
MSPFIKIFKAWLTSFDPSPEEKITSEERAKICDQCPKNVIVPIFGHVCDVCHCPLDKKIFSPINDCPLKKWKK